MSWPPSERSVVDALRRSWAAADREQVGTEAPRVAADAERIWRAVSGELPPEEVQALAEEAARDAELAHAWRLALELRASMPQPSAERRLVRFPAAGAPLRWAIAATLAVAIGAGLWLRLDQGPVVIRGGEPGSTIAALVAEGSPLSRRDFHLRWTPLADRGARYTLRLTTADLRLIAEAPDLATADHQVPPRALAGVPPGATLLWQVDARLPGGAVVSSTTFHVVLRD